MAVLLFHYGGTLMSNKKWLKGEVKKWVKEDIITQETGSTILSRYHEEVHSYKDVFFIMAAIALLGGLFAIGASVWSQLSRGEQLMAALTPLVLSVILLILVVLFDKKIPLYQHWNQMVKGENRLVKGNFTEKVPGLEGESEEVISSYKIPFYIREIICAFHGGSLLLAVYLIQDAFFVAGTLPLLCILCAVVLLILMYLMESVSLGTLCVVATVAASQSIDAGGWIHMTSWVLMIASIPFLFSFMKSDRQYGLIILSWVWAIGILFLISGITNMVWKMMFLVEAAAFTWLIGSSIRSHIIAGNAIRALGSVGLFSVLLVSSWGELWNDSVEVAQGWMLWTFFIGLLICELYFIITTLKLSEWLSVVAGVTPIAMLLAAVLSLWDVSGASSAIVISSSAGILACSVILRGIQTRRSWQSILGFIVLFMIGVLRMVDSTLSLSQRGIYAIIIGLFMILVCTFLYWPKRLINPLKRKKISPKTVGGSESNAQSILEKEAEGGLGHEQKK